MLPATTERVRQSTAVQLNERIDRQMMRDIEYFRNHPDEIAERLEELTREWDVERAFQTMSSIQALVGLILGTTSNRKWLIWSAVTTGFLLQHALQGWRPPVVALRRLGVRTSGEICDERCALEQIAK